MTCGVSNLVVDVYNMWKICSARKGEPKSGYSGCGAGVDGSDLHMGMGRYILVFDLATR